MDLRERDLRPEMMDDPELPVGQHRAALRGLARLNWLSRSVAIVWGPIAATAERLDRPVRVIDVASGSGDVLAGLAKRARRRDVRLELAGCDVSTQALRVAQAQVSGVDARIRWFQYDVIEEGIPEGYDIVVMSLFLHHLREAEAVRVLRTAREVARETVIVNDLVRSRTGLVLAQLATRLVTRSPVVHYDGPQSVRASFTLEEVRKLAKEAGLAGAVLSRHWPQRWRLVWHRRQVGAGRSR